MALTAQLADQLDWHWRNALRPRLEGLTDDEYFWEPVRDCWTLHRDGTIDFAHPAPEPAPFTTIAWRLAHVIVGVLAMRNHSHFGGPPADYQSWPYATDAATASALRRTPLASADPPRSPGPGPSALRRPALRRTTLRLVVTRPPHAIVRFLNLTEHGVS